MFVGKYLWLGRFYKILNPKCAGAAIGSLGRHTQITPDGTPILGSRFEVLLKVSRVERKLAYLTILNRMSLNVL